MGSINYGHQVLSFDYKNPGSSQSFNKLLYKLLPSGLYEGGDLTINNNTQITLTPLVCYIVDNLSQLGVRIETTIPQVIPMSFSQPYIILRFRWVDSENNFMDMLATDTPDTNNGDLIVGKGIYDPGLDLVSIDYSERSTASLSQIEQAKDSFRVTPTDPPTKQLNIKGGKLFNFDALKIISDTVTIDINDTSTVGRNDLIFIDNNGTIQIEEGVPAVIPLTADYGSKLVIAEIHRGPGRTNVKGDEIVQVTDWDAINISSYMRTRNQFNRFKEGTVEDSLEQLGKEYQYAMTSQKSLLIYYAFPSSINGSFSSELQTAVNWFLLYDIIIISYMGNVPADFTEEDQDNSNSDEWNRIQAIVMEYKIKKPTGLVFGYIPIGSEMDEWSEWYDLTDVPNNTAMRTPIPDWDEAEYGYNRSIASYAMTLQAAGYTDCNQTDIGKLVEGVSSSSQAPLMGFDNINRKWWVDTSIYEDYFDEGEDLIIVGSATNPGAGIGAGAMEGKGRFAKKLTLDLRELYSGDIGIDNIVVDHPRADDVGEVRYRVAEWKRIGVDGIFWDEAGWDFCVTRKKQRWCKNEADKFNMYSMWNSWWVDASFGNYVEQSDYYDGLGLVSIPLRANIHPYEEHGDLSQQPIRVFVDDTEYPRYTGGGDPPAGQYKEDSAGGIVVNKNTTLTPYIVTRNYVGNRYSNLEAGNIEDLPLQINTYDWWLYESYLNHGNFDKNNSSSTSKAYGWETNSWLRWKSNRAKTLKDETGGKVACVTRCAYTDMFLNNDPAIMSAENFRFAWNEVLPEQNIINYLTSCYVFSIMYGFDSWGHADPNYHATSGKTYPFSPPRIPIDLIDKEGSVQHSNGPDEWGPYRNEAVFQRGYTGGLLQGIYDGRPSSDFLPITYKVFGALEPILQYVGGNVGMNAMSLGGIEHTKYLQDGGRAKEILTIEKDIRVEGNIVATPIMEDPLYYEEYPNSSDLFELQTPDCVSAKGRLPLGHTNTTLESSKIGNQYHPDIKEWPGRVETFFPETTNLIINPYDLTSWSSSETIEFTQEKILGYRLTKFTTITGGEMALGMDFPDSGNYSFQGIFKKGNDSVLNIVITDWDSIGDDKKLYAHIDFDTQSIYLNESEPVGTIYSTEWLDDTTVLCSFVLELVTGGNWHGIAFSSYLSAKYTYMTALQLEVNDFPTPFTEETREQGAADIILNMPSSDFSVDISINPSFKFNTPDIQTIFGWFEGSNYLKCQYNPPDTNTYILVLTWVDHIYLTSSDIGKTIRTTTLADELTGVVTAYDNVKRWIWIEKDGGPNTDWENALNNAKLPGEDNVELEILLGQGSGILIKNGLNIYGEFGIYWFEGGTERKMLSLPFDDGADFENLNQQLQITLAFSGDGAIDSSRLFIDKNGTDIEEWDDIPDIHSTTFPTFSLGHNGSYGLNYSGMISYIKVLGGLADYESIDLDFSNLDTIYNLQMEPYVKGYVEPIRRSLVGFWEETINPIQNPSDLSVIPWGFDASILSRELVNMYVNNQPLTLITTDGDVYGSFGQDVTLTGSGNIRRAFQGILRKGASLGSELTIRVNSNSTLITHVTINWAAKTINFILGSNSDTIWLDDETIYIKGITGYTTFTDGRITVVLSGSGTGANGTMYATALQIEERIFNTPFTEEKRFSSSLYFMYNEYETKGYIECYVKPKGIHYSGERQIIFCNEDENIILEYNGSTQQYRFICGGVTLTAGFDNGTQTWLSSNTFSSDTDYKKWTHIKTVWDIDGDEVKLNINGDLIHEGSGTGTINFTRNNIFLGNHPFNSSYRSFDGYICDFIIDRVYNATNEHYVRQRPYYARNRMIGKNSSWKIDESGTAFFKKLVIHGDLVVHGEIISDKTYNPVFGE